VPQRVLRKAETVLCRRTSSIILVIERCTAIHNYTALIRTAEALGIQHVWLVDKPRYALVSLCLSLSLSLPLSLSLSLSLPPSACLKLTLLPLRLLGPVTSEARGTRSVTSGGRRTLMRVCAT
jgi:hypothetical protein